jgi:hypothetical protein
MPRNTTPEPQRDAEGNEVPNAPACVSSDGRYGVPRPGFTHAALRDGQGNPRVARGVERIECATCPYNQWDSKPLLNTNGKGKATTNQRIVYVMVLDDHEDEFTRQSPVQLTLPPTSLPSYDEYLTGLINRATPVQTVITKFSLERVTKNGFSWSVAQFANQGQVSAEMFGVVMERRAQFQTAINPNATAPRVDESAAGGAEDDEDLPF